MNNMKMKQNELLSEMKQALDLVSNLSNFILEEKDVSNNAKIIIKKIGDIHSVLSGSTFTAKSFFDSAFEFATSCKDKAIQMIAYCESLKQENEQLFISCQKPKCFNQGTNTEDCFVQDLQLKEDHAAREAELLAVAARLKADRRQLKDRVVDQFAVIETLKRQVETDKIVIAGLERQVSEALLEERRSSEEEDGAVSGDEEDEVLSTGRTASGRDHRRHDKNTYFEHSGHSASYSSRQSASNKDAMTGTDYLARRHHKSSDRSSEPHRSEDIVAGLVNSHGIRTSGSSRARRYDHHNDHEDDHEYDHINDKNDHMDSENMSARRSDITNSKPPRPTKPPVSAEEHRAQLRGASNEHRGTPSTGPNQDNSNRMNHQSHTNAREKSERHVQEERSDDRKSSGLLSTVAQLSLNPDTNPTRHQHSPQNSNQQNQQHRHVSYHRLPEDSEVRSAVLPPRQREEHDGGEEVREETEEQEQSGEAEGDELMSSSWETVRDCEQSLETSSAAVDTSADMLFSLVNQYYNASPTNG